MTEEVLRMALVGLQAKRTEIDQKVAEIEALLKGKPVQTIKRARGKTIKRKTGTRTMSAAGRARIAAAQKKRWAKVRKLRKEAAVEAA